LEVQGVAVDVHLWLGAGLPTPGFNLGEAGVILGALKKILFKY